MHLKRLDLIGLHLTGLHFIRSYISQNVYLRCLYLMSVALLAGTYLTGVHLDVHLEAAVPKPAAPELCPRPISCPIVSPESTRATAGYWGCWAWGVLPMGCSRVIPLFWGLTRQGVRHVTIVAVFQEKACAEAFYRLKRRWNY
jgi:hypothetical protein